MNYLKLLVLMGCCTKAASWFVSTFCQASGVLHIKRGKQDRTKMCKKFG